ncbi:MAG: hypothetical protein U5K30_00430 [Acidimicrobiales bacterium]|nr:hypothetical protein [Acidimicrobiales bacterium]
MAADDLRALTVAEGHRLVDFAETTRVGDWTLRSSLVRYAQRSPVAASAVLEVLRRTDGALAPYARQLQTTTIADVADTDDTSPGLLALLEPAVVLDELGHTLAAWAHDRTSAAPDAEVRDAVGHAHALLEALGVPRETRPPRRAG